MIRFAEHPKVPTTLHNRSALHNDAAKFPKLVLIVVRHFEHSFIIYTCLVLSSHMVYILANSCTTVVRMYMCSPIAKGSFCSNSSLTATKGSEEIAVLPVVFA